MAGNEDTEPRRVRVRPERHLQRGSKWAVLACQLGEGLKETRRPQEGGVVGNPPDQPPSMAEFEEGS